MRMIRFVLIIAFASSAIATVNAAVPLANLARHVQFNDIKISPDGDYVAASAIVEGKTILSLIHLADMKDVNLRLPKNRELAQF